MEEAVVKTDLPGALSRRQGKVRDIYDYGDGLLIVLHGANMPAAKGNDGYSLAGSAQWAHGDTGSVFLLGSDHGPAHS